MDPVGFEPTTFDCVYGLIGRAQKLISSLLADGQEAGCSQQRCCAFCCDKTLEQVACQGRAEPCNAGQLSEMTQMEPEAAQSAPSLGVVAPIALYRIG